MEQGGIQYKISHRGIKYPRIEFTTGEILFVLPFGYGHEKILEKHRNWIQKRVDFIEECLGDTKGKELVFRTDEEFKSRIYALVKSISRELKVEPGNIYFRKMRTKWASFSPKKNLTIDKVIKYLPVHSMKYIIFHETAHIIERRHSDRFWEMVSKKYKNYQEKEREMFVYWFLIKKQGLI